MKKLILLILVIFSTYSYPQTSGLDEYIKKGDSYLKENDLTLAYSSYNNALKIVEQGKNNIKKAEVYEKLGFLDFLTSQYNSALERYNTAFQIYSILNNNDGILRIYEKAGDLYFSTNNFQNAVNLYQNSTKILNELKRTEDLIRITLKSAKCDIRMYNYDKALGFLNSLDSQSVTEKDKFLIDLFKGEIFHDIYQLNKGFGYLKKCEAHVQKFPEYSGELFQYIGDYYRSIGVGNKAVKSYEKSFEGLSKYPDNRLILENYENLGDLFFGQKKYNYAYRYYEEGEKYADKYDNLFKSNFEIKKQTASVRLNYTQNAIDNIFKKIEESEKSSKKIDFINYNLALGTIFQTIGNFASTHKYILRSIKAAQENDYTYNLGEQYSRFGYAFFRLGRQDSSRIYLGKAVKHLEDPKSRYIPVYYDDKDKKTSEFYKYAALSFSKMTGSQNLLKAFEYSVKSKLVNYKSVFEKQFNKFDRHKILNKYYEYLAVLDKLKKEYCLYRKNNDENINHIKNLEKRINKISEKIGLEEINIRSENEFLANMIFFNSFKISEDYLRNIPENYALIDYSLFDDICLLFLLKHDVIRTKFFRISGPILKPLTEYIKMTKNNNAKKEEYIKQSYAAFKLLLEPVMDEIGNNTNLIIIPDCLLNHVNFETLICDTTNKQILLDSGKISSIQYSIVPPDINYITQEKDKKNVLFFNFGKVKNDSFNIEDELYENSIKLNKTGKLNTKRTVYSKYLNLTEKDYPVLNTMSFDAAVFNTHAVFTDKKPNLTGILTEDTNLENFINLFHNIDVSELIFPECYFIKDDISDGNSILSSVIAAKLAGINNVILGDIFKEKTVKSFRDIKDSNDLYYFLNSFPKKYIN